MSSDICSWPGCPTEYACSYAVGACGNTKRIVLCDKHDLLVSAESPKIMKKARSTVGMEMPKMIGRGLTRDEQAARCCVIGCGHPASLAVTSGESRGDYIPVCEAHTKNWETIGINDNSWQLFVPGCGTGLASLKDIHEDSPEQIAEDDVVFDTWLDALMLKDA